MPVLLLGYPRLCGEYSSKIASLKSLMLSKHQVDHRYNKNMVETEISTVLCIGEN